MPKKTLILAIILVALIALAYGYQGPLKKWQSDLGKPKNILAEIKIDAVDKIEIIEPGKTLTLTKQGEKWKYDKTKDFYADASVMAKAFNELKVAASSDMELVSNNEERKSEFKTDDSGMEIKLYQTGVASKALRLNRSALDATEAVIFIIGDGAVFGSSYISLPESAATYAVKADLGGVFKPAEWRDLTIFSTPAEKINKIRFQYPNREFTVELKNGQWSGVLPDKFAVKAEKIKSVLDLMSNLEAREIPDQVFANTDLNKHFIIIEATGESVNNILMLGGATAGLYYAKRGDSDNIYLISKQERDELDKWSWQLK